MCLPDSPSRVMSLALGYQEGHLLGFYPIFRIEGAADHLDPEDWISEPSLSKWRSPRGSDRISKDLSVEGIGTDVVPRDVLSSATLTNALDPRGDSRAGARPPTSSAVFRPIFRIEGAADHLDPEDWIQVRNDCSRSMELLFTPHPPSSGGFRPTVSLSARAGSAGNPSSQA